MKRAGPQAPGPGGGGNNYNNAKRARESQDNEPSFEDLMMLDDEFMVEQMVEGDDADDSKGENRWARADVVNFDPKEETLGMLTSQIDIISHYITTITSKQSSSGWTST